MSADFEKVQIWGGVVEITRSTPDPSREAFEVENEGQLTKLREHSEELLSHLKTAYDRGDRAEPFDKDKTWSQIERLAFIQYAQIRVKQQALDAAERKARYRAISDILKRARAMIDDAMQSPDLADGLMWSWWEATTEGAKTDDCLVNLTYFEIEDALQKLMRGLAALEAGAARASAGVRRGPGRPRGSSVLSSGYIHALADLYRQCTGSKPGAGQGPFARFVAVYVTAIGHGNVGSITDESLVDAIKSARSQAHKNRSKWGRSPFDD